MRPEIELEKRFFYRLIKVISIFIFLVCITAFSILAYSQMPKKIINNEESLLICSNSGTYPFNTANIWIDSTDTNLEFYIKLKAVEDSVDQIASVFCQNHQIQLGTPVTDPKLIDQFEETTGNNKPTNLSTQNAESHQSTINIKGVNYILQLELKTEGSWYKVFSSFLYGVIGSYIIINIVKETLLYLAFAKKFSWHWINILYFFKSKNIFK